MATVQQYTDPYLGHYRVVPSGGPSICTVCRSGIWRPQNIGVCDGCSITMGQVSRPLSLIVPMSLCLRWSQLHDVLRGYKNGHEKVRGPHTLQIAALVSRFMDTHAACITAASGGWDVITNVPSQKRPGTHPFATVLRLAPNVAEEFRPGLLGPGPVEIKKRMASDRAFVVTGDVRGLRVLLADDMFTSGGNMQSAASALQLAGALVVAGVTVGRYIRPEFDVIFDQICTWSKGILYDFTACPLCGPAFVPPAAPP